MAQTINTNVASLNAQRNLTTSQSSLSTSIQHLSSGLRINSAKDDAAGLAISERFSSQIRGINQAVRNANDGISLAQTAEGALVEVGSNLQRIRELAVQSSNATNSKSDREALQKEVTQLISEIDRVANNTSFNGTKLLDGSFSGQAFQVGANAGQVITIDQITNSQKDSLGGTLFAEATVTMAPEEAAGSDAAGWDVADKTFNFAVNGTNFSVAVAGKTGYATEDAANAASTEATNEAIRDAINAKSADLSVSAEINDDGDVILRSTLASEVGDEIAVTATDGAALTDAATDGFTVTAAAVAAGDESFLENVDISTFGGSQRALEMMDNALQSINSVRADLGAVQNRFTSTIANLQATSENLSASRGRIVDADFALETANLTRSQILQQAGTAMLAQANGLPQNVLSLLRG